MFASDETTRLSTHDDPVAALEQRLAEVGAENAGAAGDDRGRHRRDAS